MGSSGGGGSAGLIKLILDTDIGTDIDDAWALALCLASPEIDLLGVTLVHADLETRAKIALKMLKLSGRDDVPVYRGMSETLTKGKCLYWAGHEGTDTDFSDVDTASARDGAVDFILDTVSRYPGEVVVCPIGPMTNVGAAIARSPETMRQAKMLGVMGTTYAGEGLGAASPEHNGCVDPDATKIVMESGIPAIVVGLNVTTRVCIRRSDLVAIMGAPFGDYLCAMTRQYLGIVGREFTHMHDPLTIASVIDPTLVTTRRMSAKVLDDGRVAYTQSPAGALDVCTDVDADRFEQMLVSRISSLVNKGE